MFMAISLSAQNAEIKVGYDAYFQSVGDGTSDQKNQYILLANSTESKFYSPMTEYLDSLKSTSKGSAEIKNQATIALATGNLDALPQKDGSYYIVKSFKEHNMRCYDSSGMELFYYDESPNEKSKRAHIDNPSAQLNAHLGVTIPREVQERLFKKNSSFDLIETDYK